jgi:hypothetical protein
MKFKIIPIVVTAVITAGVLIGSLFFYRNVMTKQPFEAALRSLTGVQIVQLDSENKTTFNVALTVDPVRVNLRELNEQIEQNCKQILGDEAKLNVQISGQENVTPTLDEIWADALFDVSEAMETAHYSVIPDVMKRLQAGTQGLSALSEMDEENVYITLRYNKEVKYRILPRKSSTIEVTKS